MELPFTYAFKNAELGTDPNYVLLNGKLGLPFMGDFDVETNLRRAPVRG